MSFTLRVGVGQGEWRADARAHATLTSCWEENHSGEGKVSMSKVDELELAEGKKKKKNKDGKVTSAVLSWRFFSDAQ